MRSCKEPDNAKEQYPARERIESELAISPRQRSCTDENANVRCNANDHDYDFPPALYRVKIQPCYTAAMNNECAGKLHPKAIEGFHLFNEGKYFEAHEELEEAWKQEAGSIRELYRGILQVAVVYLHITRANYDGAIKVYGRSLRWLKDWPAACRGVQVQRLRDNLEQVMNEVRRLGKERLREFDRSLLTPVEWKEEKIWICDHCGHEMYEKNCKVTCPNCGNRFDCSDLNIYFD